MWSQMKGEGKPVADGRQQSPRCREVGGGYLLRGTLEPGVVEPTHRGSCWDPGAQGSASLCPGGRSGRAGGTGGEEPGEEQRPA